MSPNNNLDLSFVSTIVENFDKESTDFILDLNPVILEKDSHNINNFNNHTVIESEEFDSNRLNESVKTSVIPSDLHNLNLQKFSPSPIMTCFSPQSNSPSHTFVQENSSALIENKEFNIDLKNNSLTGHLKSDVSYSGTIVNYNLKDCESINFVTSSNLLNSVATDNVVIEESESHFDTELPVSLEEDKPVTRVPHKRGDNNINSADIEEAETRLPLKKRKLSVANNKGEEVDEDFLGPDLVEEIIRRAREEKADKEDISYPAKPMISIAEIQDKLAEQSPRMFKTPAEKKEMPPPPLPAQEAVGSSLNVPPKIVTEQYNNLTYNNPTIYYHMNNVPYPFFPCATLPYFPSFLVPMNSTTTIDMNVVPKQEQQQQQNQAPPENQEPSAATSTARPKKEKKSRGRKKHN